MTQSKLYNSAIQLQDDFWGKKQPKFQRLQWVKKWGAVEESDAFRINSPRRAQFHNKSLPVTCLGSIDQHAFVSAKYGGF